MARFRPYFISESVKRLYLACVTRLAPRGESHNLGRVSFWALHMDELAKHSFPFPDPFACTCHLIAAANQAKAAAATAAAAAAAAAATQQGSQMAIARF